MRLKVSRTVRRTLEVCSVVTSSVPRGPPTEEYSQAFAPWRPGSMPADSYGSSASRKT